MWGNNDFPDWDTPASWNAKPDLFVNQEHSDPIVPYQASSDLFGTDDDYSLGSELAASDHVVDLGVPLQPATMNSANFEPIESEEKEPEIEKTVFAPPVPTEAPDIEPFPTSIDGPKTFEIQVKNPEIQGEGVSAFVTYSVQTKTTLDFYPDKELLVKRRFNDFVWLQDQLLIHHKGIIIPPLPDKAIFQTNKISGNRFSQAFVEYRRKELERFLGRVSSHPVLSTSKYLQLFLETKDPSKFESVVQVDKPGASGFFSSIISKATQVTALVVAHEVDPWFAEKASFIANLKQRLDVLITTSQSVTQHHFESVNINMRFMDALKSMGGCERSNSSLAAGFSRLSEIIAQLQICEHELAESSSREFGDVLGDYQRILVNVQRVLDWRLSKLGDYQTAERDYEVKQQRSSAKPTDTKLQSLVEAAKHKIDETKEIFECASEQVKAEIIRFESTKAVDLYGALAQFAHCNMNREICMLDLWKKFVAELQ